MYHKLIRRGADMDFQWRSLGFNVYGQETSMANQYPRFVPVVLGFPPAVPALLRADAPKSSDEPATQQGSDSETMNCFCRTVIKTIVGLAIWFFAAAGSVLRSGSDASFHLRRSVQHGGIGCACGSDR